MPLTFPQLLTFEIFAPLVLRIALGAFFLTVGVIRLAKQNRKTLEQHFKKIIPSLARGSVWYIGILECAIGVLFLIGLLTQIASILGVVYAAKMIVLKELRSDIRAVAHQEVFVYIFVFAISLALMLLGPGTLGFDLPL